MLFSNLKRIAHLPALVRIPIFLLVLGLLWAPWAGIVHTVFPLTFNMNDPNAPKLLNAWVMAGLVVEFFLFLHWWSKHIYNQPHIFRLIGLVASRRNWLGLIQGWLISLVLVFCLYALMGANAWLTWQPVYLPWADLIVGSLFLSCWIGFAEELFFRGWILTELEADYSPPIALLADSVIFAMAHFLKSIPEILRDLPQFSGLTLVGMVLVLAKRSQHNLLGISIGLHAGMVSAIYLIKVGNMVQYTDRVPKWITGINDMPTAGLVGNCSLAIFAVYYLYLANLAKSSNGTSTVSYDSLRIKINKFDTRNRLR